MKFPKGRIILFAKAPIPGQAKTRLIPKLGPDGAAALHQSLLEHTLVKLHQAQLAEIELWCAPDDGHGYFQGIRKNLGITTYSQQGRDLGERMHHAFSSALNRGQYALILGSDCPTLSTDTLEHAFSCLDQKSHQAAIAPAEDGGYVMLGLSENAASLFSEVKWGGDQVFSDTLKRLKNINFSTYISALHWDVDRPEDLGRLDQLKLFTFS